MNNNAVLVAFSCNPCSTSLGAALYYARNVYAAIERRAPEAGALVKWLEEHSLYLGLIDEDLPESEEQSIFDRPRHVSEAIWRSVPGSLTKAVAKMSAATASISSTWADAIGDALGLDSLERDILRLALYYLVKSPVHRLHDGICERRGASAIFRRDASLIGLLLSASTAEVEKRLTGSSRLLSSGLLRLAQFGGLEILDRLETLVRQGVAPSRDIYDELLGASTAVALPWDAFDHLGQEAEIAAAVLQAAVSKKERGINILLYGPPGTGKTSFAAALARRIGARLRSVTEADEDGAEPTRRERLSGLRLAVQLVSLDDTVLLFDEAEDLFVNDNDPDEGRTTNSRVFMHRLLERMTVPVIWTANDISVLGPAVLRRMTMCLELKIPDLPARTRLWRDMAKIEGVLLSEADAANLARLVPAAPAVASTALRATRLAGGDAATAGLIVEGVAKAVNGGPLAASSRPRAQLYDPALVNADCALDEVAAQLQRPGAAMAVSFLLSGPPGSGKSEWVRQLALRLGLTVLQKRASDILDPYVGGTEQNIARAFAEARETRSFLVFDEADGLLLERADAGRRWEVSQVNEMLTWMEDHALPFACTTNLPDKLDRASLRRFLVKVRFNWLTAAQARLAFERFFGLPAPASLGRLAALTPADFALVQRRAALRADFNAEALVQLLALECEGRIAKQPIGFAGTCDAA